MARGKAVALFSGGLDSRLVVKMMLDQGIEVAAIHFVTPFCTCATKDCKSEARSAAAALGISVKVVDNSADLLEAVKHPKHGYGRGLNPCIDCRILSFRRAAEYMESIGASFLVTGEVLDQRPMSQRRRAIEIIEKEAGVRGKVLRPLSAKHFPATEPELSGLVDRDRLLAISGRSRREQMDLAEKMGITDYPFPAGGCLLTEPGFAARLRSLLDEYPDPDISQVTLLRVGRHLFSSTGRRIIVPRDDLENRRLSGLRHLLQAVLQSEEVAGPQAGVMSTYPIEETTLVEAAALVARYGQGRDRDVVAVRASAPDGSWERRLEVSPANGLRLGRELRRV